MRKFLFAFTCASLMFTTSCEPNEEPGPKKDEKGPDAEAYARLENVAPGEPSNVGTAIAASVFGGIGSTNSNAQGKTDKIEISTSQRLANNPYEEDGRLHNIGLNHVLTKRNYEVYINNLMGGDENTWIDLLTIMYPEKTYEEKIEIFNEIELTPQIQDLVEEVALPVTINERIARLNIDNSKKEELISILGSYDNMLEEGRSSDEIISFLNEIIESKLNSKNIYTIEERIVLKFLTMVKHSGYFWEN